MNRAILWYFGKRLGRKLRGPVGLLAAAAWVVGVVGACMGTPSFVALVFVTCMIIPMYLGSISQELNDIERVPLPRGRLYVSVVLAPLGALFVLLVAVPTAILFLTGDQDPLFPGRMLLGIVLVSFADWFRSAPKNPRDAVGFLLLGITLIAYQPPMSEAYKLVWIAFLALGIVYLVPVCWLQWLDGLRTRRKTFRRTTAFAGALQSRDTAPRRPDVDRVWRWKARSLLRNVRKRWIGTLAASLALTLVLTMTGQGSSWLHLLSALAWFFFAGHASAAAMQMVSGGSAVSQDLSDHALPDWRGWRAGARYIFGVSGLIITASGLIQFAVVSSITEDWQRFPANAWLLTQGLLVVCTTFGFLSIIREDSPNVNFQRFSGVALLMGGAFSILQAYRPVLPENVFSITTFSVVLLLLTFGCVIDGYRAYMANPSRGLPIRAGERLLEVASMSSPNLQRTSEPSEPSDREGLERWRGWS